MFESLILFLIVIILILYILDYIGLIDIVAAIASLIVGAIWLAGKGLMYPYRRVFGASAAPPQAQDQIKSQTGVWRGRGDRMRSAVSRKPRSD